MSYADSFEAVFTYKIRRNEVGIMMNNAVAVNPKILTSIKKFFKFLEIVFKIEFLKTIFFFVCILKFSRKECKKEHKKKMVEKF
jgi:hypothetical protein